MWIDVKSSGERDALVQDYLARNKRLQIRFEAEKLGDADLYTEAAKLFKPLTTGASEQAGKQAAELEKVTRAIERLPYQIAAETEAYSPIAALFDEPRRPALAATSQPSTLILDPDQGLSLDVIRRHGFKPPSELDPAEGKQVAEEVSIYNRYRLGTEKKKANKNGDREGARKLNNEIEALAAYRTRVRLITDGSKLTKKTGTGIAAPLKLQGNRFGKLVLDPVSLMAGRLRAFDGGSLVLDAPADESLYSLLTKRFDKTKQYTPKAVETFKKLVELSDLPVRGRKSQKHKLIRAGGAIQYYNDPEDLVERLQLLVASKQAGNTGLDNEISALLDELMRTGAIPKELAIELNKSQLSA